MQTASTHLRWILAVAAVLWLLVIGINGTAFYVIAAPENQRVLQNNVGWERSYKPMIHDRLQPEIAVFGASWARDAFDYEEISALIGRPFFNHAVSGGYPYENRRFLQSALDLGRLQVVVLNLDSFIGHPRQTKFQYGFNEGLLRVEPDGSVNTQRSWNRFFAATLSGAAVGNNLAAFGILRQYRGGKPKEQLLRAYDRRDFNRQTERVQRWRATLLDGRPSSEGQAETFEQVEFVRRLDELATALRLACGRGVALKAYFTPTHPVLESKMLDQTAAKLAVWDFLRARQTSCPGGLEMWDFAYPNAITLEGLREGGGKARFFREDGHPRPSAGQLMAAQMFGKSLFASPLQDLGRDLLRMDRASAEDWLSSRQARWRGDWRESERQAVLSDLDLTQRFAAP